MQLSGLFNQACSGIFDQSIYQVPHLTTNITNQNDNNVIWKACEHELKLGRIFHI
jgi:hypothetical protein